MLEDIQFGCQKKMRLPINSSVKSRKEIGEKGVHYPQASAVKAEGVSVQGAVPVGNQLFGALLKQAGNHGRLIKHRKIED